MSGCDEGRLGAAWAAIGLSIMEEYVDKGRLKAGGLGREGEEKSKVVISQLRNIPASRDSHLHLTALR